MIELPKDAEGREIPLDTTVLYMSDGTSVDVNEFNFSTRYSDPEHKWTVRLMNCAVFFTTKMFLNPPEPPDSWEKLEEDLDRCTGNDDVFACCAYFETYDCTKCCHFYQGDCTMAVLKDIVSRIRKLRGEGDA